MTEIGSISASLTLDNSQLVSALKTAMNEIKAAETVVEKTNSTWADFGKNMQAVGGRMQSIGTSLSAYITAPLVGLGTLAIKSAIDFETAFTGVQKTVDASAEEFAVLSQQIRQMSTEIPQSTTAIAAVMESAGQLGIAKENLIGFTETILQLQDTTEGLDDAAGTLARFANITGMSQDNFDRLGSTIVDLGNKLATTEGEIAAMGLRLAGAGTQIGLTEAQILSFAGALSSVGIEAEAGGSAFSKVFRDMALAVTTESDRLQEFANIAGMSAEEFKRAFEEDAGSAIVSFIAGLKDTERLGKTTIEILEDMGFTEVRLSDALSRASNASQMFSDSLAIGNTAWKENTALSTEAEKRYATVSSQLTVLWNQLKNVSVTLGETLMPHLKTLMTSVEGVIQSLNDWVQWYSKLDAGSQNTILAVLGLTAALPPLTAAVGTFALALGALFAPAGAITLAVFAIGGLAAAIVGSTFKTEAWAVEMRRLTSDIKAFKTEVDIANTATLEFADGVAKIMNQKFDMSTAFESANKGGVLSGGGLLGGISQSFDDVVDIAKLSGEESIKAFSKGLMDVKPVEEAFVQINEYFSTELEKTVASVIQQGGQVAIEGVEPVIKTSLQQLAIYGKQVNDEYQQHVIDTAKQAADEKVLIDKAALAIQDALEQESADRRQQALDDYKFAVFALNDSFYMVQRSMSQSTRILKEWGVEGESFYETMEQIQLVCNSIAVIQQIIQTMETIQVALSAAKNANLTVTNILIGTLLGTTTALSVVIGFISLLLSPFTVIIAAIVAAVYLLVEGWDKVANFISDAWDAVKEFFSGIGNVIKDVIKKIWGFFEDLIEEFAGLGIRLLEGLWQGIEDAAGWFWNKIKGFCDKVIDTIKDAFDIFSPSKKMADQVGKFLPQGIAVGFEADLPNSFGKIKKDLDGAVKGLVPDESIHLAYDLEPSGDVAVDENGQTTDGLQSQERVSGNTFNFYSPKAIDAVEARRQFEELFINFARRQFGIS